MRSLILHCLASLLESSTRLTSISIWPATFYTQTFHEGVFVQRHHRLSASRCRCFGEIVYSPGIEKRKCNTCVDVLQEGSESCRINLEFKRKFQVKWFYIWNSTHDNWTQCLHTKGCLRVIRFFPFHLLSNISEKYSERAHRTQRWAANICPWTKNFTSLYCPCSHSLEEN